MCERGELNPTCTPGFSTCTNDNASLEKCIDNGKRIEITPCQAGFVCDINEQECVPKEPCQAGEKLCTENYIGVMTCSSEGKWGKYVECGTGKKCDAVKKECVDSSSVTECQKDEKKCSDDKSSVIACTDNNTWGVPKECGTGKKCDAVKKECVDSSSVTECQKDEKKCSDDKSSVIACTDNNTWGVPKECGTGKKCDAVKKECVDEASAADCEKGEKKCSEDLQSTLYCGDDGKWMSKEYCGPNKVCAPESIECVTPHECEKGTKKCSDDQSSVIACTDNNTWGVPKECGTGKKCDANKKECVDEASAADCEKGEKKCSEDLQSLIYCGDDGKWMPKMSCGLDKVCDPSIQACVNIPKPECEEGEMKCAEDYYSVLACKGGKWQTSDVCSKSQVCDANTLECVKAECYTGQKQCIDDNNAVIECGKDGKWGKTTVCAKSQKCDINTFECVDYASAAVCIPGDKKCTNDGTGVITCGKDGKWIAVAQSCPKTQKCDIETHECTDIASVIECKEGSRECAADNSQQIKVCKDGKWILDKTECTRSEICNNTLGAVCMTRNLCTVDTGAICNGTNLVACDAGLRVIKEECTEACVYTQCISQKRTNTCSNDYKSLYGKDGTISPCAASERCVMSTADGSDTPTPACKKKECNEFSRSCLGNTVLVCKDNAWIKAADCSASELACKDGICASK